MTQKVSTIQGSLEDTHPLSEFARQYGNEVVKGDKWPLTDINLEEVGWKTSTRAKRNHGLASKTNDNPDINYTVQLSEIIDTRAGRKYTKKTIRHELVHIWQYQNKNDTMTVNGNTVTASPDHGDSFKVWIDPLQLDGRTGPNLLKPSDYNYIIECPACRNNWGYINMCKAIRQAVTLQRYCTNCEVYVYPRIGDSYLPQKEEYATNETLKDAYNNPSHYPLIPREEAEIVPYE